MKTEHEYFFPNSQPFLLHLAFNLHSLHSLKISRISQVLRWGQIAEGKMEVTSLRHRPDELSPS